VCSPLVLRELRRYPDNQKPRDTFASRPESRQELWRRLLISRDVDIAELAREYGITPSALASPARWFLNWLDSIESRSSTESWQLQQLACAALDENNENKRLAKKYYGQHAELCESDANHAARFRAKVESLISSNA
jgi:hypothetical protein